MTIDHFNEKIKTIYGKIPLSSLTKRIIKGGVWNILGNGISRLLLLITMILLARTIGQIPFGEFGIIQSTLGFAGLLAGLALGTTSTKFIAQYITTDKKRTGRIIGLTSQITFISIFLITILLYFSSSYVTQNLLNAPHLEKIFSTSLLVLILNALRGLQTGILMGLEKFKIIAVINIIEGVLSLVLIIILANQWGLLGAVAGTITSLFISWLIALLTIKNLYRKYDLKIDYKECWKEKAILTNYGIPSLLAALVATPILWLCLVILAQSENGYAEVAIYNAAYQWHGPLILIPMMLASSSIPILVQEWEARRIDNFKRSVRLLNLTTIAIAIIPISIVLFFSEKIMMLYGNDFKDGWQALILLALASIPHALSKILSSVLLSMNMAWHVLLTNFLWAITIIIPSVLLIPKHGATALAISFLTAYLIQLISLLIISVSEIKKARN